MINILTAINQHSLNLLLVGLLCVVGINLYLWRAGSAKARRFSAGFKELPPIYADKRVSVLVAAWNEADHIKKHIESFKALRYPNKELILCAGGTDATLAIARRYACENVILLEQQPGEGKQNALRRCLGQASGEVIFLTDADCFLEDAVFERTLAPVLSGQDPAATGTSLPTDEMLPNLFIASQTAPHLYGAMHTGQYSDGIFGRNCAIITSLVEQTRAFEKNAPTGTDYVLAKTLLSHGCNIRYVPHSLVRSEFHTNINDYVQQQWRWAKNVYYYGKQFKAAHEVHQVLKNSTAGLLMLLMPLSFLFGLNILSALWILLFLHALFSRWRYIGTVKQGFGLSFPRGMILFQPLMLLIDFVAWARPLPGFIFKTDKERW